MKLFRALWPVVLICLTVTSIIKIATTPSDDAISPCFENDPRKIENLIDGVYKTRDDVHLWLAPFNPAKHNMINIQFKQQISIAMMRIWVRVTVLLQI